MHQVTQKVNRSCQPLKQGVGPVGRVAAMFSIVEAEFSKLCGVVEILFLACCLKQMDESVAVA